MYPTIFSSNNKKKIRSKHAQRRTSMVCGKPAKVPVDLKRPDNVDDDY